MNWVKRKYLLVIVGGFVLMTVVVFGLRHLGEPRFEGRALSDWLQDPELDEVEMRRGVRAIGTNAIPHLQQWLVEDAAWMELQVRNLNVRQNWYMFDYSPSIDANIRAMRGFLHLEEMAGPAIPWLVEGMNKKDNNFMFYAKALVSSGAKGREALMDVYPKVSFDEKAQIVRATYLYIRSKPELAWFYVQFINDPDPDLGIKAMLNIRQMKGKCPQVLYDAIQTVADDGPPVRQRTAQIVVGDLVRKQPDLVLRNRTIIIGQ